LQRKLARFLVWLAICSLVGCGMPPEQQRACLTGAGLGALVGGGLGAAGAAASGHNDSEAYEIGVPVGVVGGALIGGVMGCLYGKPAPPPPPPPPPPTPPPPPPPPPPQKIILRGVPFGFDKAVIRDVDKPVLDEATETLKANPNLKVYVNGYCDVIGSASYNLKLSQRRAEAVANYLEDHGIQASQLIPQGFGKTDFVAPNNTPEGRAENRRVELVPANQ